MLLNFIISAFKMEDQEASYNKLESEKKNPHASSSSSTTVVVGLKIVVQVSQGVEKSNIVVMKPAAALLLLGSNSSRSASNKINESMYPCYLKSCHLCNKNLSFDKEVYMYRGDQGFCSVECRDRQIYMDEMKELEASRKQIRSELHRERSRSRSSSSSSSSHISHKPKHPQKMLWAIIA